MVEFLNTEKVEIEDKDPIGTVADRLTIDSPDSLVQTLLNRHKVMDPQAISEVRTRHEAMRRRQDLPTTEALSLVEELAEEAMKQAIWGSYSPREVGERSTLCGFTANYSAIVGELLGFRSDLFQVRDLNTLRGIPGEASMIHGFTVLTDKEGKHFLIDLSFCQFMDPTTSKVRYSFGEFSRPDPTGLAKKFIWPGYVELTDKTLAEYLKLTTLHDIDARSLSVKKMMKDGPRIELDKPRTGVMRSIDQGRLQARIGEVTASIPQRNTSPFRFLFRK